VTQTKSSGQSQNKKSNTEKTPPGRNPNISDRVDRYTVKPEFWDSILDSIPPWGDEVAAIMLIVFGVVSFLSLLNVSSDATISTAWSNALKSLFGYGSVVISGAILGLGIVILLPKLGLVIKFPTRRILALEVAFLALLALLHLASGDSELKAIARAGNGGGYVGWALSMVIASLFGSTFAIVVYGTLLIVSIAVAIGIQRTFVSNALQKTNQRLQNFGQKMMEVPERRRKRPERPVSAFDTVLKSVENPSVPSQPANTAPVKRSGSIVRIRVNPENRPPSQRPGASTPPVTTSPQQPSTGMPPPQSPAVPTPVMGMESDLFDRHLTSHKEVLVDFNAIGTLKTKKKGSQQMVERPDGRIKRFFTVDSMKEPKRVGKRDANLPPLDLMRDVELHAPDEQEINNNVVLIENTLLEFDIDVDVVDVKVGPTVTQFAVQPFKESTSDEGESVVQRTRISRIASLAGDLALSLSAKRLRLETPVPGHSYVGIEVPNKNPSIVALRSVYESRYYFDALQKKKSPLLIPLGRDVSGFPVAIDLAQMPHLLIAGTTGSGKSVCIAAMATALVLDNNPNDVKLVMLDPKMVELSRFNGLPHLMGPVETDQERIIGVLRWCTREMDRRYKILEESVSRNITEFNSRLGRRQQSEYMPHIVIMIDEIGDLMMSRPDETEETVTRLAQKARAAGMHLVVATQRPSVDVITGLIKANFPARISFAVASGIDSRVILDSVGAETLLGRGDMLYQAPEAAGPKRLQGCYVSDDEVRAVVRYWKSWHEKQIKEGRMEPVRVSPWERGLTRREFLSETDPMLEDAIELVIAEGEASASLIQRRLGLGYPRAARIMDLMHELGIVGESEAGGRSRKVLIKPGQDPFKDVIDKRTKGK
jgi:DNA segregation ATPase FtsK/SpoIIIE-like protein